MITAIHDMGKKNFESLDKSLKSLYNDERYSEIIEWLSAPDPSINFNAALKRRHVDTGIWLLESQQFKDWKAAQGSFLWLHGIPGCGKTVLSSTVVEDLMQEGPNKPVVYFYFDFNDDKKQYHDKMLRSLVLQLFSNHRFIPEPLVSLFKSCQDGAKPPQTEDLETLLRALIDFYEKTFIVLDALDECENGQELLDFIEKAMEWKSEKLNLVMTSRKLKDFKDFFDAKLEDRNRLSIQNDKVDEDICSYVRGKLQSDSRFKRWQRQPKVQEEIESKLMEKSDGMFRWAACQLDVLSSCLNLSKLRQALNSLPKTLDETYDRILSNINPLFKQEVFDILQWLTCSRRPLSLKEVAEVVAFDVHNDNKFNEENRLAEPEDVLELCSSLVINIDMDSDDGREGNKESFVIDLDMDSDDGKEGNKENNITATSTSESKATMVRIAHFSVKEYLVSNRIRAGSAAFFSIDEKVSNTVIGDTCLSCLQLYDEASFSDSKVFSKEFPLAKYSAKYWNDHLSVKSGQDRLQLNPLAIELFLSEEKMRNWIDLYDLDPVATGWRRWVSPDRPPPEPPGSPLYYAVLTGLENLVQTLIEFQEGEDGQVRLPNGNKPKSPDNDDSSVALQYMSKDAYVNATGGQLHNPLRAASWLGRIDIVRLLVKHGADPIVYGGLTEGSALSAAAHNGYLDTVELLLSEGADLYEGILSDFPGHSKESNTGSNDAKDNHEQERGAIDETLKQELNTLSKRSTEWAQVDKFHEVKIQPPIDRPDRRALCRRAACFEAASLSRAETTDFLFEHGAARSTVFEGFGGGTALFSACRNRHDEVVLEQGARVDKTNILGRNALNFLCGKSTEKMKSMESMESMESIARTLLDKGAIHNCTDNYRKTLMIGVMMSKYEKILKLFLEKGVYTNTAEKSRGSLLRAAAVIGHEPTVRLLIEHGADINEEFPLIEALRRGHKDIAKLLVEKKANVNAVQEFDFNDGIPFWLNKLPATRHLAQIMLQSYDLSKFCFTPQKRESSERQGYLWEDSPLWVAAALGDEESVKMLLDNGANPNKHGACAMTPLHIATIEEHKAVVKLLLAASDRSYSRVEGVGDGEPGSSTVLEPSNPRLEIDPGRKPKASQEASDNPQLTYAADRGSEIQTENPLDVQPADSPTDIDLNAQHQLKSFSPDSISPYASKSPGPLFVIGCVEGQDKTINLFEILSEGKAKAKANGDEMSGRLSSMGEAMMRDPGLNEAFIDPEIFLREGSQGDKESEGGRNGKNVNGGRS